MGWCQWDLGMHLPTLGSGLSHSLWEQEGLEWNDLSGPFQAKLFWFHEPASPCPTRKQQFGLYGFTTTRIHVSFQDNDYFYRPISILNPGGKAKRSRVGCVRSSTKEGGKKGWNVYELCPFVCVPSSLCHSTATPDMAQTLGLKWWWQPRSTHSISRVPPAPSCITSCNPRQELTPKWWEFRADPSSGEVNSPTSPSGAHGGGKGEAGFGKDHTSLRHCVSFPRKHEWEGWRKLWGPPPAWSREGSCSFIFRGEGWSKKQIHKGTGEKNLFPAKGAEHLNPRDK